MNRTSADLLSRKLLASNVVLNLLGTVLPILAAIVAIPVLVNTIGTESFGILSLVWMFIGYFSLFDLGLGRATTKLVAEKINTQCDSEIPTIFWTSSALMVVVSVVGLLFLYGSSSWLVHSILKVSSELEGSTISSFQLVACILPFIVHSATLRGFLAAHQRVGLISLVRIPQGVFNFAGPLFVILFTRDLVSIVVVLIILRLVIWLSYLLLCLKHYPELRTICVSRIMIRPLLSFGGWMTVSNVVSPVMVNLDKIFIGSIVSVTAIAFYTAPYQVVTQLLIIPTALQAVLFPALSHALAVDPKRAISLFRNGLQVVLTCQFPILLIAVLFAGEGLTLWLGDTFAEEGTLVVQILAAGVFLNGLAMIPFAFLQGGGRPDITAKFHLLELPCYICLLLVLLPIYGIVGAAIAWSVRAGLDLCFLLVAVRRLYSPNRKIIGKIVGFAVLVLTVFLAAAQLEPLFIKVVFFTLIVCLFAAVVWIILLNAQERKLFIGQTNSIKMHLGLK